MSDIFEKIKLTASQLRTIADRRYDDAEYLRKSNQNRHANGVFYLGGFVLECLLKAMMLEEYPELKTPPSDRATLTQLQQRRLNLVYRWHDLQGLVVELPKLVGRLNKADPSGQLRRDLVALCQQWSVFARYSPHTAIMEDANGFLKQIKGLRRWLK